MAFAVTYPDLLEMIAGEKLNLTIDFTNVMAVGDVAAGPQLVVRNAATNETAPSAIIGVPFFSGNKLNLTLSSAPLRPETSYVLTASATVTGGSVVSVLLNIKVVY